MNLHHVTAAIFLFCIYLSNYAQNCTIPFNAPNVFYEGRIRYTSSAAVLAWPGSSVTVKTTDSVVTVWLQDSDTADYISVFVDSVFLKKIHPETILQRYTIACGSSQGAHTIQLFKRTGWDKGQLSVYGFDSQNKNGFLPYNPQPKRAIEFYGNSITCGYAVEDSSGKDSGNGYFENNYVSYAAITARHFNAHYSCIAKGGIGLLISWFDLLMPQMYDRLNPEDSTSKWDFRQFTPAVVIVNIGQNDSWLVKRPKHEQFKKRFGQKAPSEAEIIRAYSTFISRLREHYPAATFICVLGNMDATRDSSPWPQYITSAVAQLRDPKILTHFFPYKNTLGHPSVAEQKNMANDLIKFINENVVW